MKTQRIKILICLLFLITGCKAAHVQSQWEVPGDHFSLEGALELFRKSSSPQQFEQLLNDADSKVNNLDLNGDGYIDYIRVIDMTEKKVHVFVLQAVISEREFQDVAVITLEKLRNGKAALQIIGDADIYGVETIIEPTHELYTHGGTISTKFGINVWSWPSVQYIYSPHYSVWTSPWGWSHRPVWWHTWRPVVYHDYYAYWSPYRNYYAPCYTHRIVYAHQIYWPHRTSSVMVHSRHHRQITHYRSTRIDTKGRYRHQDERSGSRESRTAVRYDSNGRINSRSSTSTRAQQTIEENRTSTRMRKDDSPSNRSASEIRSGSNSSAPRSSELRRIETSGNRSGASNKSTGNRRSSLSEIERSGSSESNPRSSSNNNVQRSTERTSGNSNVRGSTSSPNVQRSSGNSNVQRSSGSSKVRRSSGSSNVKRSSGNFNVQRSSGSSNAKRSSGSSNVQRSSGSSNVKRSSGNSNVQRSSGSSNAKRSSGSSNVQRSSGNSNVKRSSGNSNVQRSSGSSSAKRSSGSSNVQRSSGSSDNKRSSGSSGVSNTQRSSGSSSSKERGRH